MPALADTKISLYTNSLRDSRSADSSVNHNEEQNLNKKRDDEGNIIIPVDMVDLIYGQNRNAPSTMSAESG
jgi:hypothetical protein